MMIYNCHAHVFKSKNVPEGYLPLGLVRILTQYELTRPLAHLLNSINPFSDNDIFDRYACFIKQGDQVSQENILKGLMKYFPWESRFVILSVDMDFMEAGKAPLNFEEQLKELADLKRRYPDHIYPFVCADPRRPNLLDLVKRTIEKERFTGLKIYPPMGFYPFDEKLYPVYEYAEKKGVPILTHCNKGKVYYRGKIPESWLTHPKTGQPLKKTKNQLFTQNFTDPDNWVYVLKDFKRLKLCFGHFGGEGEWRLYQDEIDPAKFEQSWYNKIKRILMNPEFPNTYADISYTLADLDLVPLLNVTLQIPQIRGKVLFGTDFYFSNIKGSEYKFCIELRSKLGEENFRQIAEINPQRFLA
jgi:predicted TIM-barrel fold metal-dependent hydrolase